ncbi:thiol-disulfide oxidoreductase DCC family protein [Bacillus sp. EB106-08-02-XG196]|jgi:predicted DCC family thiol-disulfide oxidoreductase YuxK|uniref:thiol-disulfide oxidoreductase DCC family protein n=1 Tax=Bacillus sp. EB106-08-02-XG196 TaxID=2737049 RepID=UPI0015C47CCD|nr:thiol-disulfide oxidoreductase DCC family protein [Bacillus sp. EB106-08-02-XG196]NWQ42702.1 thiol-disulfide oxidoreductase DCC family protein [Bacillus sp. EB106-08-02-XG196]
MESIILFDGVCNFCNSGVQFIIKRDSNFHFKFASLQSETGQMLLNKYGISNKIDSMIVIENEKVYIKSSAALRISKYLDGNWKYLTIFKFLPTFFRDFLYDILAKNRYKWFGKMDTCMLPALEMKKRFLD